MCTIYVIIEIRSTVDNQKYRNQKYSSRRLNTAKRISELKDLWNYPEYSTDVKEREKFQIKKIE